MSETWFAVAAGGALGAVVRAGLIRWVASIARRDVLRRLRFDPIFATILPNALGCLILGFVLSAPLSLSASVPPPIWQDPLLVAGFCGGLTTFSTLCSDAVRLRIGTGRLRGTLLYLALTLAAGFLAFGLAARFPG